MMAWRRIAFGDLHVSARTLDRCLRVLRYVRECAKTHDAKVVCTGDFWDQRGVLSVRQVNAVQDELDEHLKQGIEWDLIPGNHDQVTRDGLIHGLRVFSSYENIRVINKPVITSEKIALVPWREDPKEQARIYRSIPAGYTVFGHGEVKGSVANNGHRVHGHWGPKFVKQARAVYLGHFHKRQQLAPNLWYLGSPYEITFAEYGTPHGLALITSESIEPQFIDLPDLPKHWRVEWPHDATVLKKIRAHDIVELRAPREHMDRPEVTAWLDKMKATDVRLVPATPTIEAGAPIAVSTPSEAIDAYVDSEAGALDSDVLRSIGHELFAEAGKKSDVAPLGKDVRIRSIKVSGFCAIRDPVQLVFPKRGVALLTGRMGSGKTSLVDAVAWCLFGQTAPRKAGAHGAAMAADAIIHDAAQGAMARVNLTVDGARFSVLRTKRRGQGARIRVKREGVKWEHEGITDTQTLVHGLVGLDYDLWRSCVSLGQGEVGSFATDAQKRRTELLERAFQLTPCPIAQKRAREELSEIQGELEPLQHRLLVASGALQTAREAHYEEDVASWETGRKARLSEVNAAYVKALNACTEYQKHIASEDQWKEYRVRVEHQLDALLKSGSASITTRVGNLHAQIGGARAEHTAVANELRKAQEHYHRVRGNQTCAQCGQALPLEQYEQQVADAEGQIETKQREVTTAAMRIQNLTQELGQFAVNAGTDASKAQEADFRRNLVSADNALRAIATIRGKLESAQAMVVDLEKQKDEVSAAENPFIEKQRKHAEKLAALENASRAIDVKVADLKQRAQLYAFWERGFGPKGLPVFVLRAAIVELEDRANGFLAQVSDGTLNVKLRMEEDDLEIQYFESKGGELRERDFKQLSGGQRRCAQLAFAPFALSEMIFSRLGVRVRFMVIDELTVHLDQESKPMICEAVRRVAGKAPIVVIDHDPFVQGQFDRECRMTQGKLEILR
jgi:energy-coupling factor transporter ATP-binding protein EcfA2